MADKDFRVKLGLHVGANAYIEGNISSVDRIQMNTASPTAVSGAGQLAWNIDESTVDVGMNANTTLQLGQEQYYYVKNHTVNTIPDGTVVRANGTNGASGRIHVEPAIANGTAPSKYILGLTTEAIAAGEDGFVTSFGKVRHINTSMFSEGDILYANPAVAGGLSNTVPVAPNNIVTVAIVINKHASAGTLFVRPTYGSTLYENEAVTITGVSDGQAIVYVTANSRFENKTVGGTSSDTFKTISVAGQSNVVANSSTDTLTFVAGSGVTITTDAGTDTITFASAGGGGDASNAWVNANDYATLLSARSNDYATLLTAQANDYNTLLTAQANDGITLASARANDYNTYTTLVGEYKANDYATYTTLAGEYKANDYATYTTLAGEYKANDYNTLLTAQANDYNTLLTAQANDYNTLLTAQANDYNSYTTLVGEYKANDYATYLAAQANDGVTLASARANDYNSYTTLVGEYKANDYATYLAAQANDYATLVTAYANDHALYSSIRSFNAFVVAGQSDVVADGFTDTVTLVAGSGMTITTDAATDTITFASAGGGGGGDASNAWVNANDYATLLSAYANDHALYSSIRSFNAFVVAGQSDVVADGFSNTVTLVAGSGMTITTDPTTDSITLNTITDLSYSANATTVLIQSSSGTDAVILEANATVAGAITTGTQSIAGTKTFLNTISGSVTGNAGSASVLETTRTITLTGDLSGYTLFNGSADVSINATIQANSVELGADTYGNYVANVTGTANEVEVSGSGESAAVVIGLPANVTISNDLFVSHNLVVTGNLTVTGNTTIISANNLAIQDNMIYLNDASTETNPDLGFAGNFNDGSYSHAGIFRDATDARWKFFGRYDPEPGIYIDTSNATFRYADVQANTFYGVLTGNSVTANSFAIGSSELIGSGRNITNYAVTINARGSISGSQTIDLTLGNFVTATAGGSITWTFTNSSASHASGFVLELTNGGSAAQTWPATVRWPSGTAPTLTASGVDVLVFVTDNAGTDWRGVVSMLDSK